MTSPITSGLLFPLPVSWRTPSFTLLSLVTPFLTRCQDPTLDRIDFQRYDNIMELEINYYYKPLFSGCRYPPPKWEFLSHTFDMDIYHKGGHLRQTIKAHSKCTPQHMLELSSRWGAHMETFIWFGEVVKVHKLRRVWGGGACSAHCFIVHGKMLQVIIKNNADPTLHDTQCVCAAV